MILLSKTLLLTGAPNNAGGFGVPTDRKRPGEHCVAYEAQNNLLNDIPCSYSASHLCQSGKGKFSLNIN